MTAEAAGYLAWVGRLACFGGETVNRAGVRARPPLLLRGLTSVVPEFLSRQAITAGPVPTLAFTPLDAKAADTGDGWREVPAQRQEAPGWWR